MSKRVRSAKEQASPAAGTETRPPLNLNAAGVDIGAAEIWIAVPAGRSPERVRVFCTFTAELQGAAAWLLACGVDTVAMESTGVYWIPFYEILEAHGLEVRLVNARHVKQVAGRKSDLSDCQWLQQLHTYGLLNGSFRPPEDICALRSLVRHRETLLQARAVHIQHMQKALHLMNLQLGNVLRDITGFTGLQILRAIVAGEHDPLVLARFRHGCCGKSEAEIAKSLEGHYKSEHLFALQQALELYDIYNDKIAVCDVQIEQRFMVLDRAEGTELAPLAPARRKRRSKNSPTFDLRQQLYELTGVDLTAVDGIDVLSAQTIISEIGLDMSRWPTVKHFAAWLGLAPQHDVSGGKLLRNRTKRTQNRAATAFRLAAQSLSRSDSAVGAFYRRIRAKHGPAKAVTATAHKLARIVFTMLRDRTPYRDAGAASYDEQAKQRAIHHLKRKAKQLGLELVAPSSEAAVS